MSIEIQAAEADSPVGSAGERTQPIAEAAAETTEPTETSDATDTSDAAKRRRKRLSRRVMSEERKMNRQRRRLGRDEPETSSAADEGSSSRGRQSSRDAGGFGMRRPLRYLSHKLDLDDKQTAQLARILDDLKIERAQAAVDDQRVTSALARAIESEVFDSESALEGAQARVEATERLQRAAVKALGELHSMLDEDQREALAYLVRNGVLTV